MPLVSHVAWKPSANAISAGASTVFKHTRAAFEESFCMSQLQPVSCFSSFHGFKQHADASVGLASNQALSHRSTCGSHRALKLRQTSTLGTSGTSSSFLKNPTLFPSRSEQSHRGNSTTAASMAPNQDSEICTEEATSAATTEGEHPAHADVVTVPEKSADTEAALAAMNQLELEESSRTMAKVVRLGKVSPHPNADRLSIAEVGGWRVVVSNASQEGDMGVYFEIDSILPAADWHNVEPRMCKIKTMKFRGELSQGLFLPRNEKFPVEEDMWVEGTDLTQVLGIDKRIVEDAGGFPMPRNGVAFSSVFNGCGPPKTDEPRVQSNLELLGAMRGKPYYIAEKIDGTSGTFGMWEGELKVCSRNMGITREQEVGKVQTAFWAVADRYNLQERLARNPDWIIQAEVYGPGLQKNKLKAPALKLAVFNVSSISEKRYLNFEEFKEAARVLDLPTVNILEEGECFNYTLEELLEKARGKYPGTQNHREGIVIRPKVQAERSLLASLGHLRLSFKVINNDFLLKYGQ